ncbi:MAG: hypothetical protein KAS23_01275, partial [Anaerohalosphaera sp.]|nr:hypothetical protein [Anaerohalosphaera sp.]
IEMGLMNDADNLYIYTRINNKASETMDPNYPLGLEHWYLGKTTRVDYVDIFVDIDNNVNTGTLMGPAGNQIGADWTLCTARRACPGSSATRYAGWLHSGIKTGSGDIPDVSPVATDPVIGSDSGLREVVSLDPWFHDDVDEWEISLPLSYSGNAGTYALNPGNTINIVTLANRSGDTTELDWAGPYSYTIAALPDTLQLSHFTRPFLDASFNDWADVPGVIDGKGDGSEHHDLVEVKVCNDDGYVYCYIKVDDTPVTAPYRWNPWLTTTPWNEIVVHDQFGTHDRYEYIGVYFDTDNNDTTGSTTPNATGTYVPMDYGMGIEYSLRAARRVSSASKFWGVFEYDWFDMDNNPLYWGMYNEDSNPGIPDVSVSTGVYEIEVRVPFDHLAYSIPATTYPVPDANDHVKVGDTIKMSVILTRSAGGGTTSDDEKRDWLNYPFEYVIAEEQFECGDFGYPTGDVNKDCYVDINDLSVMTQEWLDSTIP